MRCNHALDKAWTACVSYLIQISKAFMGLALLQRLLGPARDHQFEPFLLWIGAIDSFISVALEVSPVESCRVATVPKPVIPVQVRELVEFALRSGDLGGERDFVGSRRALAGIRGHQRIQRSRPPGYQKEVPLVHELAEDGFILRIQGRLDGLLATAEEVLLEEIKTVQNGWDGLADPLHWAQAKFYGFIYAHDHALPEITLQLTYLNLETSELTEFRNKFSFAELSAFFEKTTAIYLEWIREQHQWRQERDQSIRSLAFPFPRYRPGQRKIAVAAYRTLARGGRLFLEAPTGIGKTISVLFPAVKAMAEGKLERIFYLTARTVGRTVAAQALADLRAAGLRLRTVVLTAKEKICLQEGHPCDAQACPYARGYYDRRRPAMREALQGEDITASVLAALGRQHQVCPFELSLDLSLWVDAIVCDYNYVFDPKVYLRRHFGDKAGDYGFLVDEAHNLVDRAREMFSAELNRGDIEEVRRTIKQTLSRCAKALARLSSAIRKLGQPASLSPEPVEAGDPNGELDLFPMEMTAAASPSPRTLTPALSHPTGEGEFSDVLLARSLRFMGSKREPSLGELSPHEPFPNSGCLVSRVLPPHLIPLLEDALKETENWLAQNRPAEFRERLLELFFQLHSFRRTAECYDERYVTIIEPGSYGRVRLFCLDPSFLLQQAVARGKAAVFFSATLTPSDYYRALLGGSPEDPLLRLPSPFPPRNLAVLVQDRIRTQFRARAETLEEVAQAIGALVRGRPGNYLVYLPSYQYLSVVQNQFHLLHPDIPILVQRPDMSEAERVAFLAAFAVEHGETLAGFAVMGGVFGEGIDLAGDRLIGAVIVGVGLPQLCLERDLIRDYFNHRTGTGFDYAYTFPGMNRVLQAIGRVIRSETDRGAVLLIDTRFAEQRYRRLFPAWWQPKPVRSVKDIQDAAATFWQSSVGWR